MTVQTVIDMARYGELKQIAVKDIDAAIISYINLGLIELYKRFQLRTEEQIIQVVGGQTLYTLDEECMSIIMVINEGGEYHPINVEDDLNSVLTPSYNQIQLPNPTDGMALSVIYRSAPDLLTDVADIVPIPKSLLEALLHYIGYRGHGSMDGNVEAENNTHYTRFEASISRVTALGLITPDDALKSQFDAKGYA